MDCCHHSKHHGILSGRSLRLVIRSVAILPVRQLPSGSCVPGLHLLVGLHSVPLSSGWYIHLGEPIRTVWKEEHRNYPGCPSRDHVQYHVSEPQPDSGSHSAGDWWPQQRGLPHVCQPLCQGNLQ
uniref:Uncharacterized protein n=1 Tax=Cacopsylla melanoneura TaxID=428564 RepID=A0A8D8S2M2_9HEMI